MSYTNACLLFGGTFIGSFFMGAVHPVLGWLTLAVCLFVTLPIFWRATVIHNTEVAEKRRRENIETQMMRGKLDAQLIRDVAGDMKRQGRL